MGPLGFPEVFVVVLVVVVYGVITPFVLSISLRILVLFADLVGLPEALGKFGATLAHAFREHKPAAEE